MGCWASPTPSLHHTPFARRAFPSASPAWSHTSFSHGLSHRASSDGCTGPLFPKLRLPQSGAVSCHNTQETRDLWEAPAYTEPQKKLSLVFLLPKTFSKEEQRKACQDLATFAALRHSLFQAKAVPESDESKLATQAAAASVFPLLPSETPRVVILAIPVLPSNSQESTWKFTSQIPPSLPPHHGFPFGRAALGLSVDAPLPSPCSSSLLPLWLSGPSVLCSASSPLGKVSQAWGHSCPE